MATLFDSAMHLIAQAESSADDGEISHPDTLARIALAQAYATLAQAHELANLVRAAGDLRDEIARLPGA